MSTVKEVRVELTAADEKALSAPRSRKRTRKSGGSTDAPVPPQESKPIEPPTLPTQIQSPPEPAGIASPIVEKAMPMNFETALPPPPPTLAPQVAQAAGAVKIQTRKRHAHAPVGNMGTRKGAIILPVKRHKQMTKDKPRLVIPVKGGKAETGVESATPIPIKPIGAETPTHKGGKRRFTERRLSISLKNLKHTRKAGKSIRKQVAKMTTDEIRKTLLEKKIIKPSSNPPESMLRSMMKDYLALAK